MYLMNVSFGPTTSTPSRPSCGFAYSSQAARCRPTAVLPVPGPPWITSAPCASRAISSYWSGVIVEMIWRISPTRWRVMSSTIASVRWSSNRVSSGSSTKPSTWRSSMSSRRRRRRPCGSRSVAA